MYESMYRMIVRIGRLDDTGKGAPIGIIGVSIAR